MYLILEALFVGIYSAVLFRILFFLIKNEYSLLFTLGFLKHFLSYYVGIQSFFCNHGYACKILSHSDNIYIATDKNLFIESFLEGLWFLTVGTLIFNSIGKVKPFIVMFVIGFFTHLLSEKMKIHKYFCKYNCKPL